MLPVTFTMLFASTRSRFGKLFFICITSFIVQALLVAVTQEDIWWLLRKTSGHVINLEHLHQR